MNPGKVFEEDFKLSIEQYQDVSWDRFKDSMGGYKGVNTICDFVVYEYPYQFYFELKCYAGNSIPLEAITQNQVNGLMSKVNIRGVHAGVVLRYHEKDDHAYFIDIRTIKSMQETKDAKSIPYQVMDTYGIILPGVKSRTRIRYDFSRFLESIVEDGVARGRR